MLRKTSEEALVDNAVHRKSRRALQIFRSPFYPKRKLTPKAFYHLSLMAMPDLVKVRDRFNSR
jgi:hypothetical protein